MDDWSPRLAITPDGTAWVVWMGVDPVDSDEEAYYSRWNGTSWDLPATVNPPNLDYDRFPEIAVSQSGSLWCLWVTPSLKVSGAYVGLTSHWTGSGWSLPDTVWQDGGRYDERELAAVSDNEAWFGRSGQAGSTADIFLYHVVDSNVESVYHYDEPADDELSPSLAVDSDGIPWAAWYRSPYISPSQSQLQYTRFVNGNWTAPETIPSPQGIDASYVLTDATGGHWIACLAEDPVGGYQGLSVWTLHWTSNAWDAPIRVSERIASNDSTQFHLSATRNPHFSPTLVWGRRNLFNYTRMDLLTSSWDGSGWTPPAIAGDLADSTYVVHPDVSRGGPETVWVSYMRQGTVTPIWHVVTTRTVRSPTSATGIDLEASATSAGLRVQWRIYTGIDEIEAVRVYRADGVFGEDHSSAPSSSILIQERMGTEAQAGVILDNLSGTPPGYRTYWISVRFAAGHTAWMGPRAAWFAGSTASILVSAIPNPFNGSIQFRGYAGIPIAEAVQIFDVSGKLVRTVRLHAVVGGAPSGEFRLRWDGRDQGGQALPSGVYFARLKTIGLTRGEGLRLLLVR